jgi:hypothetical protein
VVANAMSMSSSSLSACARLRSRAVHAPNRCLSSLARSAAVTVIVDSRVECSTVKPGVDCGATVEQWPDESAAQKRSDYIQTKLASVPMLSKEWTTVKGNLLLRVTGELKPSAAKDYEAAFAG